MKRVIAMVRTSTDRQSTVDQRNEMIEFCKSEGYDESEIELVETQGASAYKVDDEYQAMIARVKDIINNNPNIEAFTVWHINRAFRNEVEYANLKAFLVEHGVNLITKNPYLKLLTPDGKVDGGMRFAISIMAVLAEVDNEERIAKFQRAKRANSAKGKYNGGGVKYGYRVNDEGYVVPDEKQVAVIIKLYELYATGQYSIQSLARELLELGITKEDGKQITPDIIARVLADTAYIGYTDKGGKARSHRKFVPIMTQELWDKVAQVRRNNYMDIPRTNQISLASKIIKCPVCGGNLHRDGNHFLCWKHNRHSNAAIKGDHCSYSLHIPTSPTHSILWSIAKDMHVEHLLSLGRQDVNTYRAKLETLDNKIANIQAQIEALESKRSKAVDSYIEGHLNKQQRDDKLAKIGADEQVLKLRLNDLKSDRNKTNKLFKQLSNPENYAMSIFHTMTSVINERDLAKMSEIIHTYILRCTVERVQFGKADRRVSKPNALEYTVKAVDGYTYKVLHLPCTRNETKYYAWNGKKYEPMMLDIID